MNKTLSYLLLAALFTFSCQNLLFNEDENKREISCEDFHSVRISGIYNIVLIQDSTNRLVIKGRKDIYSIDAVVIDDTLIINDHKKMSLNANKNTIAIHFSNLRHLITNDPVNISNIDTLRSDNFIYAAIGEISEVSLIIDCNYFLIVNSANTLGYFHINGKANDCTIFNRYGSTVFANSLHCKNAEIVNESVGAVYISASEYLKAYIWGPGNIYYSGAPVIEIAEKKGNGRLIRL